MSRGGASNPRGAFDTEKFDAAKYWRNTLLVGIPLLAIPIVNLLAIGWLVHRIRKYKVLKEREKARLGTYLMSNRVNIMLRNNKYIVNAEVLGEDDRFIRVVDNEGKVLLVNKNDVSILEPVEQDPMD
jgi:hypothetical protein